MDDDKEKLVIDELVDTVKGAVGDAAKAAVMPSTDPKAEPDPVGVAEKANEQVYLGGDAAVAPEAVPAPAPPVPKKKAKKTPVKIAHAKIPPAPPKKAVKKAAAKKSAKKSKKAALEKSVEKAGWTLIRSRLTTGVFRTPFQAAKQVSANAAAVTRLNAAISQIVELPPCMGALQPCAPIGALSMAKRVN